MPLRDSEEPVKCLLGSLQSLFAILIDPLYPTHDSCTMGLRLFAYMLRH